MHYHQCKWGRSREKAKSRLKKDTPVWNTRKEKHGFLTVVTAVSLCVRCFLIFITSLFYVNSCCMELCLLQILHFKKSNVLLLRIFVYILVYSSYDSSFQDQSRKCRGLVEIVGCVQGSIVFVVVSVFWDRISLFNLEGTRACNPLPHLAEWWGNHACYNLLILHLQLLKILLKSSQGGWANLISHEPPLNDLSTYDCYCFQFT